MPGPTLNFPALKQCLKDCLRTQTGEAGWAPFTRTGLLIDRPYGREERGDFGLETEHTLGLRACWVQQEDGQTLLYRVADREKFIEAVCKLHGRERVFQALLEMETGA